MKIKWIQIFLCVFLVVLVFEASVFAENTKITWHGHAAFEVVTPTGKVLMIDPWLKNPLNPKAKNDKDPVQEIKKVDYILVTHGHFDHIGDAVALATKTGARLVATFELGTNMAKLLGYPKDQMGFDSLMNIGGEISLAEGEVVVAMTPAVHSSGMNNPKAGQNDPDLVYGGNPVGYIVQIRSGPVIYHTGDTAFFEDMKLIGQTYSPDIALINIGGHFGMEPKMAEKAAVSVKAKWAVPHHFKTFPVLTQDAGEFIKSMEKMGIIGIELKPGESIEFEGKMLKSK